MAYNPARKENQSKRQEKKKREKEREDKKDGEKDWKNKVPSGRLRHIYEMRFNLIQLGFVFYFTSRHEYEHEHGIL